MRFVSDPDEKVPMDPEDYVALLEWVRAKEGRGDIALHNKTFHPRL